MKLIPFLLTLCTACYGLKESDVVDDTKNAYAFYYPLAMASKKPAQVCLAINKDLLPAKATITFSNKTCDSANCEPHTINSDFSCWKINAPEQSNIDYYPSTIEIDIVTKDTNIKFNGKGEVQIRPSEESVFIETDRRVYKMGDTVKMRLLVLGFDLKPINNYKIPSLRIRSPYPSSATVVQWENITLNSGLKHFEFQLAPDAPEGIWSINGDGIYISFEVKKYILPRFQTSITGPSTIFNGSKTISYLVCAKYSYGRNVKGIALLTATGKRGFQQEPRSSSETKNLKGGCAKFDLSDDLDLHDGSVWSVELTAAVTEEGTDQVESDNKYVSINRNPYSYQWDYSSQYIKPELPYVSKFSLSDVTIPLTTGIIELCTRFARNGTIGCSNFTLNSNNSVEFTIPPIKNISEPQNIEIEAKVIDHPLPYTSKKYITFWHSASRNAIKIMNEDQNPEECGSTLAFTVLYNSKRFKENEDVEFRYILSSRGEILTTGSVIDKPKKEDLNLDEYPNVIGKESYEAGGEKYPVDKFDLKIKLDKKIYTNSKLVVYYVYDNEVIADVIDIHVNKCTPNKIDAKWLESPLYPGETGKLNIEAGSGSFCSISSIDKASKFLGSNEQINVDNVLNRLERYNYLYRPNCIEPNKTNETLMPFYRRSSFFDSYEAFMDSNVGIISNMKFISKMCEERPLLIPFAGVGVAYETVALAGPVAVEKDAPSAIDGAAVSDNRGSAVRSFFPETWLWDPVSIGEDGHVTVEKKLPDSITDWVGNVLCASSKDGFGISGNIEMKGFKPFFVDILLPYSIKRNKEILHLPVPIFNYLNHSLPIHVTLELNEDIVLMDGEDKRSFNTCLEAEESYTHNYRIKATKLGSLSITVAADANPNNVKNCAPDSIIRRRDVVQKSILVEPEGYPSGIIKSALLCANDSVGVNNVDWNIILPEDVVSDTVDGKIIINSDILGPMFQNLENILVVPTGCGEQTMATLTPNLYVLKYLEANNALTEGVKAKILKNLVIGYQRMLNYVHDDGSFSAFGKSDKDGSMFLTAFVIRTFRQMKKYVFIDDDVINKAIKWIISHQLENGCFDPVHHVFHEMGLASSKNQTTALTSYVLISFLETNTKIDDKVISNAKTCIINDSTIDKYTMAISSYALGLMNLTEDVQKKLNKLVEVADHKNDLTWWTQSENARSANIEVSSYVLMSLLRQNPVENLGVAGSIVRWLQTQMNPRGGFYSTEDTVVGLDAISRYAILVNKEEPNVKVSVKTSSDEKNFEITKRDRSKTEVIPLVSYPNNIKAKIEGNGCVSIQATVNYYIDKPVVTDDLKLDIHLKPVNQKLKCSLIELKPCVSYTAPGQINMAIVEVSMPSGFAPDQASLYELTSASNSNVKKFEQTKNQVIFYLTQLGATQVCLPFKIDENLIVENVANATVKLYDYYKSELSISKSFKLEDCEANIAVPA